MADHSQHGHDSAKPATFEVRILRQDGPGQSSYWERHEVPYEQDMNVISVLQRIAAQPNADAVKAECCKIADNLQKSTIDELKQQYPAK